MTMTQHEALENFVKEKISQYYSDEGHFENVENLVRKRFWNVKKRRPKKKTMDCPFKGRL